MIIHLSDSEHNKLIATFKLIVIMMFGQKTIYCRNISIFSKIMDMKIQNVIDLASLLLVFLPLNELLFVSVNVWILL